VVAASPVPVAFLSQIYKVFVWTDATYCSLSQHHREFSPKLLSSISVRHANHIDQANVSRGTNFILSSQWASDSLIEQYPEAKVAVIPFGANADDSECLVRKKDGPIRLAFLAVRWDEKGGDKAFEIFKSVKSSFIDAELHVIGCDPPEVVRSCNGIHLHGFIDKTTELGRLAFRKVISMCDYIVVPTYAEAYGLFAAEGAMFGSIVLTHNVGGLSTIIENGKSGFLFYFDQPVEYWADTIKALESDSQYKKLVQSNARLRYESLLNWRSASLSFDKLLRSQSV
jgi:glycosyltransferase involved in cell wall biosynthesis